MYCQSKDLTGGVYLNKVRAAASGVKEVSPESSRKRAVGWTEQNGTLGNTYIFGGGHGGEARGGRDGRVEVRGVVHQESRIQGSQGEKELQEGVEREGLSRRSRGLVKSRHPSSIIFLIALIAS